MNDKLMWDQLAEQVMKNLPANKSVMAKLPTRDDPQVVLSQTSGLEPIRNKK